MFYSLQPYRLKHIKLTCPSLSPRVCSNTCPLNWWCYPTLSFSATLYSFCLQSFPESGSFPVSWLFASDGQSIEPASSSVIPMNIQGLFPLGLSSLISLQSQGLSRAFSSITIQKASILQLSTFFMVQLSYPYMTTGKIIALTIWTFVGSDASAF